MFELLETHSMSRNNHLMDILLRWNHRYYIDTFSQYNPKNTSFFRKNFMVYRHSWILHLFPLSVPSRYTPKTYLNSYRSRGKNSYPPDTFPG